MSTQLTIVRPYKGEARDKILNVVRRSGLDVDSARTIPSQTPNHEALAAICSCPGYVLLVPYNGQRDADGQLTNGIDLLRTVESDGAPLVPPVLMPVSEFGAAGARLALARSSGTVSETIRERVYLIEEEELDDPELPLRVQRHVRRFVPEA